MGRSYNVLTRAVFGLYLSVLIFSPLAFGTVEVWSLTLLEAVSLSALSLILFRNAFYRGSSLYEIPGVLPLGLLLAYVLLQLIPLPSAVLRIFSPSAYSVYADTIWAAAGRWGELSLNRKATIEEFFRIASYAAFYLLTVQLLAKKERLKRTVTVVVVLGAVISFFAILQHILSNQKIFWFRELTRGGIPFGPYVNRNHYAGLMAMIFPLALSMFFFSRPDTEGRSLRGTVVDIMGEKASHAHILYGSAAVLIATSVFVSLSRGGIMSLCLSSGVFIWMIAARKKEKRGHILLTLIFILILYAVGWFGWAPVFDRFSSIRDTVGDISDMRPSIWKDSMHIIRDFPVAGTGFGSFVSVYPRYRSFPGTDIVDHAHNDYIELITDGGVAALLICAWLAVSVLVRSYRVFLARRDPYAVALFSGAFAGIAAVLIHSLTDFNLHIGANGLYASFLAGLAVAASHAGSRQEPCAALPKRRGVPFMKAMAAAAAVLLVLNLAFNLGRMAGRYHFSQVSDIALDGRTPKEQLSAVRDAAYRASSADPFEARYHYLAGTAEWLEADKQAAFSQYRDALELAPFNAGYMQMLGLAASSLGRDEAGERLLKAGIDADPKEPVRYRNYAAWLLEHGRSREGLAFVRTAISLTPRETNLYIAMLVLHGADDGVIRDALPRKVRPHLVFADYLKKTGNDEMADSEYLRTADYLTRDEADDAAAYLSQAYSHFFSRGMRAEAAAVVERTVEALPEDARIRVLAAGAYERCGMKERAIGEYEKALDLDPKNERVRKKLSQLR